MPDIYRALSFLCMHISLQYLVPWATCCTINQTLPNDVTRDPEVLVPKTQGPGCPAEGTECLIASLWTFRLRRASPLEKAYFKSSCRHPMAATLPRPPSPCKPQLGGGGQRAELQASAHPLPGTGPPPQLFLGFTGRRGEGRDLHHSPTSCP